MSKVGDTSLGKPQLRPADLNGADAAVLTVAGTLLKPSRFGGQKYVLLTREYPERELWLNKTATLAMVEHYGDETDDWTAKKVPVRAVHTDVRGEQRFVVQIAQDWDVVMRLSKSVKRVKGGKR